MTDRLPTFAQLMRFADNLDKDAKNAAKSVINELENYVQSDSPLPRHLPHSFRQVTSLSADARSIRAISCRHVFDSTRPMQGDDEVSMP